MNKKLSHLSQFYVVSITELTKSDVFKVVWPLLENLHQFKSNYNQQRFNLVDGTRAFVTRGEPM